MVATDDNSPLAGIFDCVQNICAQALFGSSVVAWVDADDEDQNIYILT